MSPLNITPGVSSLLLSYSSLSTPRYTINCTLFGIAVSFFQTQAFTNITKAADRRLNLIINTTLTVIVAGAISAFAANYLPTYILFIGISLSLQLITEEALPIVAAFAIEHLNVSLDSIPKGLLTRALQSPLGITSFETFSKLSWMQRNKHLPIFLNTPEKLLAYAEKYPINNLTNARLLTDKFGSQNFFLMLSKNTISINLLKNLFASYNSNSKKISLSNNIFNHLNVVDVDSYNPDQKKIDAIKAEIHRVWNEAAEDDTSLQEHKSYK